MSYALIIGAAVSVYSANKQQKAASDGAFWAGQGGGGGMFQGDFNVNIGGSGTAYQTTRSGDDGGLLGGVDPVMAMGAVLALGGLYVLAKK